jgi:hypothetical protein
MRTASPSKAYVVEFGSAMLAYAIVLPVTMLLVAHYPDSSWRFAFALLPVVPLCFALGAMLRFFGRIDELARKIHLEAFAAAEGVTGIATFAYGMLQNVGLPPLNLVWVLPFTIAVWGIASAVASSRYR